MVSDPKYEGSSLIKQNRRNPREVSRTLFE